MQSHPRKDLCPSHDCGTETELPNLSLQLAVVIFLVIYSLNIFRERLEMQKLFLLVCSIGHPADSENLT